MQYTQLQVWWREIGFETLGVIRLMPRTLFEAFSFDNQVPESIFDIRLETILLSILSLSHVQRDVPSFTWNCWETGSSFGLSSGKQFSVPNRLPTQLARWFG